MIIDRRNLKLEITNIIKTLVNGVQKKSFFINNEKKIEKFTLEEWIDWQCKLHPTNMVLILVE